jgi:hypothetical protein
VLGFILAELGSGLSFPTTRQIRDFMGWKRSWSVPDVLAGLAYDGFLRSKRDPATGALVWRLAWRSAETTCPSCGGSGVDNDSCACGEDTCCCAMPLYPPCDTCHGSGTITGGEQ